MEEQKKFDGSSSEESEYIEDPSTSSPGGGWDRTEHSLGARRKEPILSNIYQIINREFPGYRDHLRVSPPPAGQAQTPSVHDENAKTSDGESYENLYQIADSISIRDWLRFARTKLCLRDVDIDAIQLNCHDNAEETKYQMILCWMRKVGLHSNRETAEKLKALRDEYLGSEKSGKAARTETILLPGGIIMFEEHPINRHSRIFRGKLRNQITGDIDIVIKILPDGERERREARLHFLVPGHPQIIHRFLTDIFMYRGLSSIFMAMELCDRLNLYLFIRDEKKHHVPFNFVLYFSFAKQIVLGLEFLHRHGVMHTDLKPHNLLLAENRTVVKISDFGLSKHVTRDQTSATHSVIQPETDGWKSPEVLMNAERISTSADIFSLALVVHHTLSYGGHPFGNDPHSWNHYIKRNENLDLMGLMVVNMGQAIQLLTSMLNPDPTRRPTAAGILNHPFFQEKWEFSQSSRGGILAGMEKSFTATDLGHGVYIFKDKPMRQSYSVFRGFIRDGVRDDEPVAVKVYGMTRKKTALSEINHLKILDGHRNIVSCKRVGTVGYETFLAMELCQRNTLFEIVKQGLCTEPKTILLHIALGLSHIHDNGIVHMDLKPQNILRSLDGKDMKIIDFGLSRSESSSEATHMKGTPGWLSPEVMEGEEVSQKSDIYSFGLACFFVLSGGTFAFQGNDFLRAERGLNWRSLLRGVDERDQVTARNLIEKVLAWEPNIRISIDEVLKHPYFWDDDTKLDFLCEVGRFVSLRTGTTNPRSAPSRLYNLIDNIEYGQERQSQKRFPRRWVEFRNDSWLEQIESILTKERNQVTFTTFVKIARDNQYRVDSCADLLKFICVLATEYYKYDNLQKSFESRVKIWFFLNNCFPNLLCNVYDKLSDHVKRPAFDHPLSPDLLKFFNTKAGYLPLVVHGDTEAPVSSLSKLTLDQG